MYEIGYGFIDNAKFCIYYTSLNLPGIRNVNLVGQFFF